MAADLNTFPDSNNTGRLPRFGARAKVIAFAFTFMFFLSVQVLAAWAIYSSAHAALRDESREEMAGIAATAAESLSAARRRGSSSADLSEMVWRIRESNRLDNALLTGVSDNRGGTGAPAVVSAFAATPSLVRSATRSRTMQTESLHVLGERFYRVYQPVALPDGKTACLVLDSHDESTQALAELDVPLAAGVGSAVTSALVLAAAVVVAMRYFDQSQRRLRKIERLATAGELASSIAHEVKNPMGIILTSAQLLQKNASLTPEHGELLAEITEEVKRAEGQLDSYLDLARDIPIKPALEDMKALIESTVSLVAHRLERSSVKTKTTLPDEDVFAVVDRRKMRQAIVNVLLNSLEAFAGNGGTVRIELKVSDGEAMVLEIWDNGPGMSQDTLQRATEPFFSTKQRGTGLGLAQTEQIVARHGGQFTIDSSGNGTVASIMLPKGSRTE